METDKSNRFGITDIDTYRRMGEVNTKKDRGADRTGEDTELSPGNDAQDAGVWRCT